MTEMEIEISDNRRIEQAMGCAFSIAGYAGVELSRQQASDYAKVRNNRGSSALSDQKLLYFFLEPDQQAAFRNKYAHMDFESAPEQIDAKLIRLPIANKIGEQALSLSQVG
jgi:hypothetical protein